MEDPLACEAFPCTSLPERDVAWCEKEHCPFAHQRRREEVRAARDRRDRLEGRIGTQPINPPVIPEGAES